MTDDDARCDPVQADVLIDGSYEGYGDGCGCKLLDVRCCLLYVVLLRQKMTSVY